MKKCFIVLLTICCLLLTTACNDKRTVNSDTENTSFVSNGTENNESIYTQTTENNESIYTQTIESEPTHQHSYVSTVTKEATCTSVGTKEYRCICGESYTETINKTDHSYSSATCTSAKKCTVCGATSGEPLGHNFSNGYCTRCHTADPTPKKTLNIPSLPLSAKYFVYEYCSSVKITNISYEFNDLGYLFIYISGEKTDDHIGNSGDSTIAATLKLYDSEGYLVDTTDLIVSNLKVGEKFRNKEKILRNIPQECTAFTLEITDCCF